MFLSAPVPTAKILLVNCLTKRSAGGAMLEMLAVAVAVKCPPPEGGAAMVTVGAVV